jgi:hypothetical protein
MPGMAVNSPGLRHSGHDPSPTVPHHHASAHTRRSVSDPRVANGVDHGRISIDHQCCYDSRAAASSPCAASRRSESRAQIAAPKFANNPLLAQSKAPALTFTGQAVNLRPVGENVVPVPGSHSPTLRI